MKNNFVINNHDRFLPLTLFFSFVVVLYQIENDLAPIKSTTIMHRYPAATDEEYYYQARTPHLPFHLSKRGKTRVSAILLSIALFVIFLDLTAVELLKSRNEQMSLKLLEVNKEFDREKRTEKNLVNNLQRLLDDEQATSIRIEKDHEDASAECFERIADLSSSLEIEKRLVAELTAQVKSLERELQHRTFEQR